jgi:hypothetical protein
MVFDHDGEKRIKGRIEGRRPRWPDMEQKN